MYRLLVLALIINISSSYAQNGQLSGFVRDAKTLEPLIGVAVRLDGTSIGGVTDVKGFYTIQNIPSKSYNIEASYVGYKNETRYNFVIKSGGNPELNFEMEEATNSLEEVVVVAKSFQKGR